MKFDVTTNASPQGIITTAIESVRIGLRSTISTQTINTHDHQIREALIMLGWTPPDVAKKPDTKSEWQPAGTEPMDGTEFYIRNDDNVPIRVKYMNGSFYYTLMSSKDDGLV